MEKYEVGPCQNSESLFEAKGEYSGTREKCLSPSGTRTNPKGSCRSPYVMEQVPGDSALEGREEGRTWRDPT